MAVLLALILLLTAGLAQARGLAVQGFATNDCYAGATVNVTVYQDGELDNPSLIVDSKTNTTEDDGGYGVGGFNVSDSTPYDVRVSMTNTGCSPGAYGTGTNTTVTIGGEFQPPNIMEKNITLTAPFANDNPGNDTVVGNNETTHSWASDYVNANNYTLEISTDSGFTTVPRIITGIAGTSYTLTQPQALPDDTYYWRVKAINASGATIDTTEWTSYHLSAGAAVMNNFNPANDTWHASGTVTLEFDTDKAAECRWSDTSGTAFSAKTAFSTTGGTSHSGDVTLDSEGANTIYLTCNASGLVSPTDIEHVLNRDTTPPNPSGATVTIDDGNASSTDTTLDFTWSGFTDGGTGITTYYYSFDDNSGTTSGTSTASPPDQLVGASQGTESVYVWAEDAVGNIGSAASDSITVDSIPPIFQSWSTNPSDLTKYSSGDFTVRTAIDEPSGIQGQAEIRYRIGSDAWTSWKDMTLDSAVSGVWNYIYTIPEQSSPDTWFERSGENLSYQVRAIDNIGHENNVTRREFINEEASAPIFDPIPDHATAQDSEMRLNLTASDVDMNTLTYTCNLSEGVISRVDDTTSTLIWTPDNDDVGTDLYQCNVTDGTFVVSQRFDITVTNVNDDPVLQPVGDLYAQEYEYFNYTLNASDIDGDLLIYGSNATIFSLNGVTGEISFTPFSSHRGEYRVNLTVEDGEGGVDYESIMFTVGYCGDDVCKEDFEDCSTCEADCGICGEEEKSAILVEPRNCLGDSTTLEAVKLVPRATCEEQGDIIDGMEVCGNESQTTLRVYLEVEDDAWEEVAELVTDDDGFATFEPEEAGEYKVSFGSGDEETFFEVKECMGLDEDEQAQPSDDDSTGSQEPDPSQPPVVEEPSVTDESGSKWSLFSILLYFLITPLLAITMLVSATGFVYRLQKRQGKENGFVKQIDTWSKEWDLLKRRVMAWMIKTPGFKDVIMGLRKAKKEFRSTWRFTLSLVRESWVKMVLGLGMRHSIRFEYFDLDVKGHQRLHLLLVAVLKNLFPERKADKLLGEVLQYQARSVLDTAALLLAFGAKVTYHDPAPGDVQYLNALISKGLQFKSRAATRVHLESSLEAGRPVLAVVNELGDKNTVMQSLVAVYAFDKEHFYYHDFPRGKKGLKASKDAFMHAWKAAGSKGMFVEK